MMTELFEKSKNPFFKFGDVVLLQKIEQKHWLKYLPEAFASTKRKITEANAQLIIDLMDNHPYFIQQLAHEVWNRTTRYATAEIIHETLLEMYSSMSILYQKEVDLLSTPQVNFLKAVVDGVERFTTLETLHKYDLGSSSNIKRIKTALESKEVIDLMEPKIDFVDPLFKLWFKNVYIPLRN